MRTEETDRPAVIFNQTEAEKAEEIGMSRSWLQKDRMKPKPTVPFRRYGGAIRYAKGTEAKQA